MIADFDIEVLKKDLHKNLILVERQISNYSDKFRNILSNYFDEEDLSFLKKIAYKTQNDISDYLCDFILNLTNILNENKEVLIINNKIKNYVYKNEFIINKKIIYELDIKKNNLILSLDKNDINKIAIVNNIFISYKKSLNFAIKSLNKKVCDLVDDRLKEFNVIDSLMKKDEKLFLVLSFFNISYDNRKNNLYIYDSEKIINLIKIKQEFYKINNKINVLIKYEKDKFWVALDVNKRLVKIISYDNKNKVITFTLNKNGKQIISYRLDDEELYMSLNKEVIVIKKDNLNDNIKKEIEKIEPCLLNFIIFFSKKIN